MKTQYIHHNLSRVSLLLIDMVFRNTSNNIGSLSGGKTK